MPTPTLAALAKQAAEELGIDVPYWYEKKGRSTKLTIRTQYQEYTWTPPDKRRTAKAKTKE